MGTMKTIKLIVPYRVWQQYLPPVINGERIMKYIVNKGKKFATLAEACRYADAIHRKTGVFVSVEAIRPKLGGIAEPLLVY